jgi:hypothetical protein
MKKNKIISGVMAIAALCAVNATAQISYHNGDLLAGFRNGGNTDVIVDLGSISLFQQPGTSSFGFTGLGSALTGVFGPDLSGVSWSVFGVNDTTIGFNPSVSQTDPNSLWTTLARSNPNNKTTTPLVASSDSQQHPLLDIEQIASSTSPGGGNPITSISANIVKVVNNTGFGYTPSIGVNGDLSGDWYNIEHLGSGVSDLYQSNPNSSSTARASYLGNFSLDSLGDLNFNPVPEPSTVGILGFGMMSLLALRRYGRNK